MKWSAVAFAILFAVPGLIQSAGAQTAPAHTAMTPTPDDRAKQWLTLVDDSNFAEAWKQAGENLRAHIAADSFTQSVGGKRAPMGAMSSRTLKDIKLAKTVPGMKNGQYAVVRYDSAFAHQTAAVETVTLVSDNGGWSVIGYHID